MCYFAGGTDRKKNHGQHPKDAQKNWGLKIPIPSLHFSQGDKADTEPMLSYVCNTCYLQHVGFIHSLGRCL